MNDDEVVLDEDTNDERAYGALQPAKRPSQVYSIRIPVERLEELRRIAELKGTPSSALMRSWVLERLDRELSFRTSTARLVTVESFEATPPAASDPRWRLARLASV